MNWYDPSVWTRTQAPKLDTKSPMNNVLGSAMKTMMRCQFEMWALNSRRTQAYLELPTRMARCRTPAELAQEQQRFAETAYEQYALASDRMSQAMTNVAVGQTIVSKPLAMPPTAAIHDIASGDKDVRQLRAPVRIVPRRPAERNERKVA